jgi:hypothetical protein
MITVGIDWGKYGAVCILSQYKEIYSLQEYDLFHILDQLDKDAIVFIERPFVGKATNGMTGFLINYGRIIGYLKAKNIVVNEITPKTWISFFNLKKEGKNKPSIEFINRFYPQFLPLIPNHIKNKSSIEGIYDSICISLYGQEFINK